jgi:hypothetical protein
MKDLENWMQDLTARVDFMLAWLERPQSVKSYWLPALFFSAGVLHGCAAEL